MSDLDLDELARQLQKTSVGSSGVSFEGKSLKLNTAEDAKEVVEAIDACPNLEYLNLEGNTLGIDAAKAIAKALESHKEFKRALWKDLFTGRMKDEIPKALQFLGAGLVLAGASLTELDLSDNAFGPVGVEGLVSLLRSSVCYSLQTLKLNNNGLGVTGGKMLSRGLLDCYEKSKEAGQPLALKVFVAGRNRLENEGATALAEVFKKIGSLEELCMPQNGIYHVGIKALCDALTENPNLQVLNLNDNTVTAKGATAMAKMLPALQQLREINLGDCLLKTKGAILLAEALTTGHRLLQDVLLESNEIGRAGGLALAKAMRNKDNLKTLVLGGNQFGEAGRQDLQSELTDSGRLDSLGTLSDDEEEDEEDDDDDDNDDDDEEEEEGGESESEEDDDTESTSRTSIIIPQHRVNNIFMRSPPVSLADFLQAPTPEKFLSLGNDRTQLIIQDVQHHLQDVVLEKAFGLLMKVSSLCGNSQEQVRQAAFSCSDAVYQEIFKWGKEKDQLSIVNNGLLVHLGLIKSEDKKLKVTWNLEGCMQALGKAVEQDYFPESTRETLKVFLHSVFEESQQEQALNRFIRLKKRNSFISTPDISDLKDEEPSLPQMDRPLSTTTNLANSPPQFRRRRRPKPYQRRPGMVVDSFPAAKQSLINNLSP